MTPDKWAVQSAGCWLWLRFRDKNGYGKVSCKRKGKKAQTGAHRVALAMKLGRDLLPGMFACHTCDAPSCVNPNHLYEGTPMQNYVDMRERNPQHDLPRIGGDASRVLTREQADIIRERVLAGEYQKALSIEFDVCAQTVSDIVNGITYGYNGEAITHMSRRARRKHPTEQVIEAKRRARSGETLTSLEKAFGMSGGTMTRIMQGKLYGEVE